MAASAADRAAADSHRGRIRRAWCCSFAAVPASPEPRHGLPHQPSSKPSHKPQYPGSFQSSPSPSSKLGLSIIGPRRILSPGRVSPIDSDPPFLPLPVVPAVSEPVADPEQADPPPRELSMAPVLQDPDPEAPAVAGAPVAGVGVSSSERSLDLRLNLKGRDGRCVVLEMDSKLLSESSDFFAAMVLESRHKAVGGAADFWKIEVAGVEDLGVFRETIELMYEKDAMRWLAKAGVARAIDVLEVSSTIMFGRGVNSCLRYLEAVPWSESEEEKLKSLFARCNFEDVVSQDVLARLCHQGPSNSDKLAVWLIQSVTNGSNCNARKELQSLVNGLLSKSSVYQKDAAGLDKESMYDICHSCLNSLLELFKEASGSCTLEEAVTAREKKPLVERVSKQVENLNWLLEILIDKQMAEDFVGLWAEQKELIRMHEKASPMVRYELSRLSASVFIALGKGKVQCRGDMRSAVLLAWFAPMLMDFGWLQRCSKGMDMRLLEEGLGQALLTLPLKQQQALFVDWFRYFSAQGTECPNLGKAFQVWWRRSFVRPSEAHG